MLFYYIAQTDWTPALKLSSYFILPSAGIAGYVTTSNFPLTLYLIFHVIFKTICRFHDPYFIYQLKD